jgi:hypothetical protein
MPLLVIVSRIKLKQTRISRFNLFNYNLACSMIYVREHSLLIATQKNRR